MPKLSALIKSYKGDLSRVYRDSCLELGNRIIESTPVDTGRARQSWSANGPPSLGRIYSFSSNLEYINELEFGHSEQAPRGMVRINTRNWNRIVAEQL